MRVLMIGPTPPPVGGTTVLFESLVDGMRAREDVSVEVIGTGGVRGRGLAGPAALSGLEARIARGIPWADIVTLHVSTTGLHVLGPLVVHMARRSKKPIVIRKFGGTDFSSFSLFRKGPIMWALSRADLYLAETRYLVRRGKELGLTRVEWYPNNRAMPPLPRREEGPPRPCLRFIFLSQLYKAKGVIDLIEAADSLPEGVGVDIYGTLGFDLPASALENRKNVSYRGPVEPTDVPGVLAAHDALVLPTYYPAEGYPGVILEAYAAGLPVISTRAGAIPELVDETTGILIEPRDIEALRKALLLLSGDPALCERLRDGVAAKRTEFSDETWQDKFVEYCRGLRAGRVV